MFPESYPINTIIENSDFLIGALTSLIGAIGGFVLTFVWDKYKHISERTRMKILLVNILDEEIKSNLDLLKKNCEYLEYENGVLAQQKIVPVPLGNTLSTSSWELFRLNLEVSKDNIEDIKKLKVIYARVYQLNDLLSSSKIYKITNGAMTNYESNLTIYNKSIIEISKDIIDKINQLGEWANLKL